MTDRRVERFNTLIDRHQVQRLRAEDATALKVYRLLERARQELFGKLLAFEDRHGTANSYTQAYLAAVLDDINATMAQLRAEAIGTVREQMLAGYAIGQEHTFAEVATFYAGAGFGNLTPRVPTDVVARLLEGRVGLMETTFRRLELRIAQAVREAAGIPPEAARGLGQATAEEVRQRLALGVTQGEGTRSIARRLMAPGDGEFVRLSYKEAILQTRLNLNDAFNDGHLTALQEAAGTVDGLRSRWVSALVRSTPVCLCLHGQHAPIGGVFTVNNSFGGRWSGTRPPAIGQAAKPIFHLCRSRIVPDHAEWPENPKLAPLTSAERTHFHEGGDFREKDIAKRKVYPGFSPRADASGQR